MKKIQGFGCAVFLGLMFVAHVLAAQIIGGCLKRPGGGCCNPTVCCNPGQYCPIEDRAVSFGELLQHPELMAR